VVPMPHFSSHDTGIVGAVADGNDRRVIDEVGYLLRIMLIGWREVECRQLSFEVHDCMEFETIVPTLPVLTKGDYAFGYPVPVGSH